MKNLLIKITSRQRPEKFFNAVDNIIRLVGNCNYQITTTLDLDDESMNNMFVRTKLADYDMVVYWSLSKNKIHAYNRGIQLFDKEWDVIVATSDDMRFTERYFGEQILNDMEKYFPDSDGILHYPDGRNNRLITLPIIGRKYYLRTKTIYNQIYETQYADDEQMQVAKRLGRYQYIPIKLFHHDYPKPNETKDSLYLRNEKVETIKSDKEKYLSRLQNNFA